MFIYFFEASLDVLAAYQTIEVIGKRRILDFYFLYHLLLESSEADFLFVFTFFLFFATVKEIIFVIEVVSF